MRYLLPLLLLGFVNAHAITLTDIQEVRFDGTTSSSTIGGGVLFKNLRVRSAHSTFDDYIEARYTQNESNGSLVMQDAQVFPGVGIFQIDGDFFAKDVPSQVFMYRNIAQPNEYAMDTQYTISSSSGPFYMNLTAGQRISFHVAYPSAASTMVVTSPSGREILQTPFSALSFNTNILFYLPVFESGTHRIDFVPDAGSSSSIKFRFLNDNRNAVRVGENGKTESFVLRAYSSEYEKIKLTLLANQTATLALGTLTGPISVGYANSKGSKDGVAARGFSGSGFTFTATQSDDYYLFFHPSDPVRSSNTSVSLTVGITSNLSFSKWGEAYSVSALRRAPLEDSDGDGSENIIEYAFGTNPSMSSSEPNVNVAKSGSQAKVSYKIPTYVEGIIVVPQESSSLDSWLNVTPVPAGSDATGNSFEATSTGSSPNKFLRLKVE